MRRPRPMTALLLALAALAAVVPAPAAAQEAAPPTPVDSLAWVRVQQRFAVPRRVTGVLFAADSQSVTVRPAAGVEPVVVPLAELERMHVSLGRRSRGEGALRGARYGLLGGLAVSAVLVAIGAANDAQDPCGECFISATAISGILGVALTTTTTVGGAIFGAASPGEKWVRVRTPVVLAPARP